ncbi:MAG: ribosomal protein S18-alanine N-acetyltransferase [Limnochordia bacterium]|jgi:ribosomal-protein-alanine N-acetyltransferase|nr:ribosomal protein S18-alanine N-acetyltransferase [Limnochordia bacterium]
MAAANVVYRIMTVDDIPMVQLVERKCFSTPWSRNIFVSEVTCNDNAIYVVALVGERIVGYAGIWIILDEGHITNIAVDPLFQRKGIGEGLMDVLTEAAVKRGVIAMTLEVRVSNSGAQTLYSKLGFVPNGIRKQYYQDDKEDALIMWRELGAEWTNAGN